MSVDNKQIDLIVNAELKNGKSISQVTQSIKDLNNTLDQQTKAAKQGQASLDELRATTLALQQAQDRLRSSDQLINNYTRLSDAVDRAGTRLQTAQTKLTAYQAKLDENGKATDAQTRRLATYAKAVETAQKAVTTSAERQKEAADQLNQLGVDTGRLVEEQLRLRTTMAETGVAIQRSEANVASFATNIRKLREEEAKLNQEAAFQKQLEDAQKLASADRYLNFFETALRDANVELQKLETNNTLQRTARDAIASANGYRVLSSSVSAAQAPLASFKETVDDIINPRARSSNTIVTMEADLKKLSATVAAIDGPIKNYREQLSQLTDIQTRVQSTGALVDQFTRQRAAVAAAGKEFTAAKAQVVNYAQAVANSANLEAGARNQLLQSLNQAQSRQAQAAASIERERAALRNLRTELEAAGVDTRNLDEAQRRLLDTARGATSNLNQLADAHKRYGAAVTGSAKSMSLFDDNGRTTLSLMQRIRGQVLALTAGYVSLFGAMRLGNESIDIYNAKISAINQLSLSTGGNLQAAGKEFEYAVGQADRLGVAINEAVTGYAKFSASASLAGRPVQENRFVYETMLEISRVAGLSAEQLNRVFFALGQIDSKGKVMAEEFNQQLGDAIPGLTGVARQATQEMFTDFSKAMKDGKVDLDVLVDILAEFRNRISGQLPAAMNSLQAAQARLNNEFYKFKLALAENGFADEYGKLIAELTAFFKSEDGKQFARDLADGFRTAAGALRWLVQNIELVQSALKIVLVLFGARAIAGMVTNVTSLAGAFGGLSKATLLSGTSFTTAAGAMAAFETIAKRVLLLLTSFTVGFELGDYIASQTEIGRKAFFELARWGEIAFKTTVGFWTILFQEFVSTLKSGFASLLNTVLDIVSALVTVPLKLAGRSNEAEAIAKVFDRLRMSVSKVGDASKETREQLARDIQFLRSLSLDSEVPTVASRGFDAATPRPDRVGGGAKAASEDAKEQAKLIKQQASLREQLTSTIESLNARILKSDKNTLESQLAAIDEQYGKANRLAERFKATGAKDAAELAGQLQTAVGQLRLQIQKQFADRIFAAEEELQSKLDTLEARAGRGRKTELDARLAAIDASYKDFFRELDELQGTFERDNINTGQLDEFRKRAQASIAELKTQEARKFTLEEMARLETRVTDAVQERGQREEVWKNRMQAGITTELEARNEIAKIIRETQPGIEKLAEDAIAYAESLRGAANIDSTKLDAYIAKMQTLKNEGKEFKTSLEIMFDQSFAQGATDAFDNIAESIGNVIAGTKSWGDLLQDITKSMINFLADLLRDLALAIIRAQILESLKGTSWGSSILTAAGVMHSGGVVGRPAPATRRVDPSMFVGAPRYHTGGVVGLAPGEYPAILKENEEVLTQSDPRNVLNGGLSGGKSGPTNLRINNYIDSGSFISAGMETVQGEESMMNFIRANAPTIKNVLGG